MAGDSTAPTPKARMMVRRDHACELIRLSFSESDISDTDAETMGQAYFLATLCYESEQPGSFKGTDISDPEDAARVLVATWTINGLRIRIVGLLRRLLTHGHKTESRGSAPRRNDVPPPLLLTSMIAAMPRLVKSADRRHTVHAGSK
jgi:hypothetical protein